MIKPEWFYRPLQMAGYIYDDYPCSRESGCAFLRGTIARTIQHLDTMQVKGDVAEFGVASGKLSRMLRAVTPRTLHLFDTFWSVPGLPDYYAVHELDVINTIGGSDGVVIHKGLFPDETAGDCDDLRLAFSFIDFNLYQATYAALDFVWDRTVEHGVILCHDFDAIPQVCTAIKAWCGRNGVGFALLGDAVGTVVIVKPAKGEK